MELHSVTVKRGHVGKSAAPGRDARMCVRGVFGTAGGVMGVYARARARKEGHGGMRTPDPAREYEQVKWAGLGYCRTMVRERIRRKRCAPDVTRVYTYESTNMLSGADWGIAVRWCEGGYVGKEAPGMAQVYACESTNMLTGRIGGIAVRWGAKEERGKDAHQGWREYIRTRVRTC